jgi:hypothetical protein
VLTGNQTASPFRFESRGKVRLRATNATRQYLKSVSPHENDCEDAIRHGHLFDTTNKRNRANVCQGQPVLVARS